MVCLLGDFLWGPLALALPRPLGRVDPPYLFGDLALSTPLRQRMEAASLDDYGEVQVMDWGLAASAGSARAEALGPDTGRAGTPVHPSRSFPSPTSMPSEI